MAAENTGSRIFIDDITAYGSSTIILSVSTKVFFKPKNHQITRPGAPKTSVKIATDGCNTGLAEHHTHQLVSMNGRLQAVTACKGYATQ